MKTTIRIPQAPAEPLPELAAFLEPFHIHFLRSEAPHALDRYLTGLLTELPNKNCDTIAASIPGTSEQHSKACSPPRLGTRTTSTASVSSRCSDCPAKKTAS